MALRNEDRDWIKGEIQKAVDLRKPRGFAYLLFWVQKLGPATGSITVIVALLGITMAALYQSFAHVREETTFRANTGTALETFKGQLIQIEARLRTLQAAQSPKQVLQELAALDQPTFAKNLSALKKVTEHPHPEVAASTPMIREMAQKLLHVDQSAPDYWPTVLQFLRFASAGLAPSTVPPWGPNRLQIHAGGTLRGPGVAKERVVVLHGDAIVENMVFERCRVRFTEGPIKMTNVVFIDCIFEFPETDPPSPYLRRAGQQLLASDHLGKVSIASLN